MKVLPLFLDGTEHGAQWRTTACDGEAVYNGSGEEKSVKARIHNGHGIGDKSHEVTHDYSHSTDLLIEDAHAEEDYVKGVIHPTIKSIFSHYSRSPHKLRRLLRRVGNLADGDGDLFRQLHYLFEVRFVASEFIALSNFLIDLPVIVAELTDELDYVSTTGAKRIEINGWLRKVKQFKFIAYLIVMVDIHAVNKEFSVCSQSDQSLIIDLPGMRAKFKQGLISLRDGGLGDEAKRRLGSLKEGQLKMADAKEEAEVAGQPAAPVAAAAITIAEDEDGGEGPNGGGEARAVTAGSTMAVAAATGDLEKRLQSFQKGFIEPMLLKFDERIQNPEVALRLRKVFDFRLMPLLGSEAAQAQLEQWSNDDIDWLVAEKFPELDASVLKNQALVARMFVKENKERFMQYKDKDHSKGKVLKLTGEGSVFAELFSRSDVCLQPIPLFLHVADYMISFMWQSCNAERAGSHMNRTKTLERSCMLDELFDSIMFCTFNMPLIHEIDFEALISEWESEGRKLGTFKGIDGDSSDSSSKVIKRLLEKKSGTFLFKKASAEAES